MRRWPLKSVTRVRGVKVRDGASARTVGSIVLTVPAILVMEPAGSFTCLRESRKLSLVHIQIYGFRQRDGSDYGYEGICQHCAWWVHTPDPDALQELIRQHRLEHLKTEVALLENTVVKAG